jgi:hypothetical protein
MAKLMVEYPGHPGAQPFLPLEDVRILLRLKGEQKSLDPSLSLKRQLKEQWRPLDQEALDALGFEQLTEEIRTADVYVELELFESYGSVN